VSSALLDVAMVATMLLVGAAALGVVLTSDPVRQAIVLAAYGLLLGVLFLLWQAPDVAMAQLAVGSVIVPLIVVLTIVTTARETRRPRDRPGSEGD